MKLSIMMKQDLEVLKASINGLMSNKEAKLEDIQAKDIEIQTLQAKIVIQEKIEADELATINSLGAPLLPVGGTLEETPEAKYSKEFINGLRNKFQNAMSTTPADGGYTVPQDIQTRINELRETKDALQNLVTVEPVTAPTGSRVFKTRSQQTGFAVVGEGGTITEKATPQFTQLTYAVLKYAGFMKVTNELLKDSDAAITNTLVKWVGDESRVTRNKLISTELALKARTAIANADGIKGVLNVTLDPAFRYTSSITTNQDGYNWLDKLKDLEGNYLLQPSVTSPTGFQLFGVPVVMVSNKDLPTVATKAPFIIGDLKAAIAMFVIEDLSIKATDVGGDSYLTDTTLFRAIEREVVKTIDAEAFVYGEVVV